MTQVTLPGEPKSHAYNNAQAHVDSIVACYQLMQLCDQSWSVDTTDLTVDMVSIIGELLWNEGDGPMALRDALEQYVQEQHLDIRKHGTASPWSDEWEISHYEILLTTGGPALWMTIEPGLHNVKMIYQEWGIPEHSLPLDSDERDALRWYAACLGLDA